MMKTHMKRAMSLLLLVFLIVSATLPISAEPSTYSKTSNSGTRDEICTTLDGTSADDYYTGIYTYENLDDLSGAALLSTLRKLMTDTHDYKSTYADCKNYSTKTDCENGDGRVLLIYTSYSATMGDWSAWNREHVWPKSLGGFETSGAGSDLHHIRPSDQVANSTRNNMKYGNVSSGKTAKSSSLTGGVPAGTYANDYFEPHDNVKGDVARICLYVYARWGGEYSKCNTITNVFQSVDVLLEWCELDPVDTWEMGRNEVVENVQGNRNVFIDYPELAWLMFDREIPSDMVTPSGEAMSSDSVGGGSTDNPVDDPTDNPVDDPTDNPTDDPIDAPSNDLQDAPTADLPNEIEELIAKIDSEAERILILVHYGMFDSIYLESIAN